MSREIDHGEVSAQEGGHGETATGKCDILESISFSAKLDYVKVATPGKCALPEFSGRPFWGVKEHYQSLTIHDATCEDVEKLVVTFPQAQVLKMEVAIDARPRPALDLCATEAELLLANVVLDIYAHGLDPDEKSGINKKFRGAYCQFGQWGKVQPFDMRRPRPIDQQLHGGRDDDRQTKVYLKRTDMGAHLDSGNYVARIEVRLNCKALEDVGVHFVEDLFGFRFRKKLMPFFRHIRGTRRRSNARGKLQGPLLDLTREVQEAHDKKVWQEAGGVGAFSLRGKGARDRVYLLRDSAVNGRLGQALLRLERAFAASRFVYLRSPTDGASSCRNGLFGPGE